MNLRHGGGGRVGGGFGLRPPARMLIDIIPFALSYVTTASGGATSPGLGGQCTPRGKGKYKVRMGDFVPGFRRGLGVEI